MPPKKEKVDTNQASKDGTGKKPRKKYKTRKKKDDCPSRARKTDRVVINKQVSMFFCYCMLLKCIAVLRMIKKHLT